MLVSHASRRDRSDHPFSANRVGIAPHLVLSMMCTSVYKDRDTKPTLLKIRFQIWPPVQKKNIGYSQSNTVIPNRP